MKRFEIELMHISGRTKDQEPGCSAVIEGGTLYISPKGYHAICVALHGVDAQGRAPLEKSIEVLRTLGVKDHCLQRFINRGFQIQVDDDIVDYNG